MSAGAFDSLTVSRDPELLAPRFRAAVRAAIAECNAEGLDAYVYEGYRSPQLQALYYARGRTQIPPTKTVTNASSNLYSWHGYGLAVDVISRSKGWSVKESWFAQVAAIFKKHGLKWGGDWKMKDLPHFQWGPCKPSPSDNARLLLKTGGFQAVWKAVGALEDAAPVVPVSPAPPPAPPAPVITPAPPVVVVGTRVLFERAEPGSRTVRGGLVASVQRRLNQLGFSVGKADGIYGGGTEKALAAWQASVGVATTGKVDLHAWQTLVSPGLPSLYERALQVTASFEEHGFGLVAGNYDGAWLTWGIIGFTLSSGTLGSLLREVRTTQPAVFRDAFGPLAPELVSALDADAAGKQKWCNGISLPPDKRKVQPEWQQAFARLGDAPEVQAIQVRYAEDYWRRGQRDADRFGLRTELGLGLCFDIAVQNGGIDSTKEEPAIRKQLAAEPPDTEHDLRVVIARVVANNSKPAYVKDVLSRKMTWATGAGEVHGDRYELRGWGLDEVTI